MTLLPIVDRELRVASRKRATYWTRVIAAGFWMLIAGAFLAIQELTRRVLMGGAFGGQWLFIALSWLAFAYTCASGIFLTSDCLSEEKREGTLGLLFLTDLRGFDVVLGKVAAASLQACYSLLAVFPIFAIPFLLGGVTGELFGKMMLILVNCLFLSLAVGVFVSSISHDSQKAINATLFILTILIVVLLAFDWLLAEGKSTRFSPFLSMMSPALSFTESMQNRFSAFWPNMAMSHLTGWFFLVAASVCAPRKWQQSITDKAKQTRSFGRAKLGTAKQRARLRKRFLDRNPALWLAARERSQSFYFKLIFALSAIILIVVSLVEGSFEIQSMAGFCSGLGAFLCFLLLVWLAAQSSRFFVDGMRTGALELLLCSPLSGQTIVRGHWRALCHNFAFPILFTITAVLAGQILQWLNQTTATPAANTYDFNFHRLVSIIASVLTMICNCSALAWFGMWMGLTTKKASTAALKTFAFVIVIPWIVVHLAQVLLQILIFTLWFSKTGPPNTTWYIVTGPIISTVLTIATALTFVVLSRRKLFSDFRQMATGDATRKPLTLSSVPNLPPVIAT